MQELSKICNEDIQHRGGTSSDEDDDEYREVRQKIEEARMCNQNEALYNSSRHIKQPSTLNLLENSNTQFHNNTQVVYQNAGREDSNSNTNLMKHTFPSSLFQNNTAEL